jgi:hypothetical protein
MMAVRDIDREALALQYMLAQRPTVCLVLVIIPFQRQSLPLGDQQIQYA